MNRIPVVLSIAALTIATAPCQTVPPAQTTSPNHSKSDTKDDLFSLIDFVKSVAKVMHGHHMDADTVKQVAAKLGEKYQKRLRKAKGEADALMMIGKAKLDQMDFQEKMNLAEQFWEVRASINLMALLTPDMLFQLTGIQVPDLKQLTDRFATQEKVLRKALPNF